MKIFFSVLFDRQTYPANIFMQNGVAIGDRHMGPLALIDFLELHLGLSTSCNSKVERIFNYRENLKSRAKGSFYEKSLETNDLEVAMKLLNWRDELKIAGWDFKTNKSCPGRLKDLAKVEQHNIGASFPERFCNIITALNDKSKLPIDEILLHEPEALLPAHFVKLFSFFAELGIKVKDRDISIKENSFSDIDKLRAFVLGRNSAKEKSALKQDGSIQVIKFGDMLSAGKGLAAYMAKDLSFKPVVINEAGNISLSLSCRQTGLPSTGQAMQTIAHPDLQLLSIIPVWLWKPYSPQQVLDFFLSPLNIFPRGLSAKWMGLFSENPGICLEDWVEQIEEYVTKTKTEKEKIKHKERLDFLLNNGVARSEKIGVEKISGFYNFFYNIFNKRCAIVTDENLKIRLRRLCNAFKEMISILQLSPESELDAFGLQKLLLLLQQSVSIIPFEKQAGSIHEIFHAGVLAGDCDDLLWFGFNANSTTGTLWDEWTEDELKWLNERNVFLDTALMRSNRDFWFLTQWLRFVKKRLIFVIPSVVNGEAAQPHPFHPFLNACFNNLHEITINVEQPNEMRLLNTNDKLTKKITVHPIPVFPGYWKIKAGLVNKREKESFSSLENLMKYPYRWVLSYKAELYRGNTLCLPDNFMFYGNLSHAIFQELLMVPANFKMSEKEVNKIYAVTVEKYINQRGLLLYDPGEESNLKVFREYLFEKFWKLLKHLKENDWQVEACEIDAIGKIGDENVGGRCDILLKRIKNKKIENAIVDLKYAGKKHRTMMENGEDLQLAIYSKIFNKDASYCPTSYFIITSGLLFTTCKEAFTNGIILRQGSNHIDTYGDALNRIGNTIKFRREELSEGKIEVGENVCKEDLAIFSLDADSYIVPDNKTGVKSMSAYNDYETFIDTE